jgi:hypothetical protein
MSTSARERFERRTQARAERNRQQLAQDLAEAVRRYGAGAVHAIAQHLLDAGYRRKRVKHQLRDELHLIVAAGGEQDDP